jgi:phosphopantothenoylcysteine decarboxylase
MARILLGITGSVAAIRMPRLITAFCDARHELKVVLTRAATYFVDPAAIGPDSKHVSVYCDADEWPEHGFHRGDHVLHIELRNWAEVLVVAPLDAHSLAKFALGLCDNLLSCAFRAWDFARPIVLAPAMNTLMWESPVTLRHLTQLLADRAQTPAPPGWPLAKAPEVFARHAPSIILVPPQEKRLACGDIGMGAMAEVATIAEAVRVWHQRKGDEAE